MKELRLVNRAGRAYTNFAYPKGGFSDQLRTVLYYEGMSEEEKYWGDEREIRDNLRPKKKQGQNEAGVNLFQKDWNEKLEWKIEENEKSGKGKSPQKSFEMDADKEFCQKQIPTSFN